jgi:hypothetical protein
MCFSEANRNHPLYGTKNELIGVNLNPVLCIFPELSYSTLSFAFYSVICYISSRPVLISPSLSHLIPS